jgi:hypothetical protein
MTQDLELELPAPQPKQGSYAGWKVRDLALVSIFSSIWIASQFTLGPIIGRFSIGPVSLHGVVNRVVGWMLMLILADSSARFGRVSAMSLIAALGTRIIRLSPITGLAVGAGYALGGITFDAILSNRQTMSLRGDLKKVLPLSASAISGALAIAPYILLKLSVLSLDAFLVLAPIYIVSTIKGIFFSLVGTSLALSILPRVKAVSGLIM